MAAAQVGSFNANATTSWSSQGVSPKFMVDKDDKSKAALAPKYTKTGLPVPDGYERCFRMMGKKNQKKEAYYVEIGKSVPKGGYGNGKGNKMHRAFRGLPELYRYLNLKPSKAPFKKEKNEISAAELSDCFNQQTKTKFEIIDMSTISKVRGGKISGATSGVQAVMIQKKMLGPQPPEGKPIVPYLMSINGGPWVEPTDPSLYSLGCGSCMLKKLPSPHETSADSYKAHSKNMGDHVVQARSMYSKVGSTGNIKHLKVSPIASTHPGDNLTPVLPVEKFNADNPAANHIRDTTTRFAEGTNGNIAANKLHLWDGWDQGPHNDKFDKCPEHLCIGSSARCIVKEGGGSTLFQQKVLDQKWLNKFLCYTADDEVMVLPAPVVCDGYHPTVGGKESVYLKHGRVGWPMSKEEFIAMMIESPRTSLPTSTGLGTTFAFDLRDDDALINVMTTGKEGDLLIRVQKELLRGGGGGDGISVSSSSSSSSEE